MIISFMGYFSIPAKNRKILLHQQKDFPVLSKIKKRVICQA
jgi:hypothetical protein